MGPIVKMLYTQEEARCYRIVDLKKQWEHISQEVIDGIYHFRVGEHSLYIGESADVFDRLYTHLFTYDSTKSSLGPLIFANSPESNAWKVYILPTEQHRTFIERYFPDRATTTLNRLKVEQAMIFQFRPALNRAANYIPLPLPSTIRSLPKPPVRTSGSLEPIRLSSKEIHNLVEESEKSFRKNSKRKKA